jgi:AcrR family transcriptional regulator
MSPERRSAEERREQILEASLELFARQGLHGVTTRMIAEAAGMSEALLYRHFRSKEALYQELQRWCLRGTMDAAGKLTQIPPSTGTLVLAVYFMVHQIVCPDEALTTAATCIKRIMLTSLIGDGKFARGFCQVNFAPFLPKLGALLEAARKAGDVDGPRPAHPDLAFWLCHHTAVMAGNMYLPDPPVVDHGVDRDTLVEEIARFALRGLGLTAAAMARHFQPRTLAATTRQLLQGSPLPALPAPTSARKVNRR